MQRSDAHYLENVLILRKQLCEVLQLKAVMLVAQRLVVSDLLKHRNVRIGLSDIAGHQLHPLVVPLETRFSCYEPGRWHGVPGVVGDDSKLRMQHRLSRETRDRRHEIDVPDVASNAVSGDKTVVEEVEVASTISGDGHVVVEKQIVVVGGCKADEVVLPHHHVLLLSCREGRHLLPRNSICRVAQFLSSR